MDKHYIYWSCAAVEEIRFKHSTFIHIFADLFIFLMLHASLFISVREQVKFLKSVRGCEVASISIKMCFRFQVLSLRRKFFELALLQHQSYQNNSVCTVTLFLFQTKSSLYKLLLFFLFLR